MFVCVDLMIDRWLTCVAAVQHFPNPAPCSQNVNSVSVKEISVGQVEVYEGLLVDQRYMSGWIVEWM